MIRKLLSFFFGALGDAARTPTGILLQVVSPRVGGSLRQALRVTLLRRYRCANSSRSWGKPPWR
ncbi:hypothetical protein [uncultured Nostoc sp.]|uniref:hypothetical protein n=1 Tax=uncultured Nostoc sp. TaxID=340711 RepID=UPI00260CFC9A|nr:hypothetical protein [uncultured Nostoc sp.]